MVQGHGAQEVVERVGQHVKGLWIAFISGEKTPCRKHFKIDEHFVYEHIEKSGLSATRGFFFEDNARD